MFLRTISKTAEPTLEHTFFFLIKLHHWLLVFIIIFFDTFISYDHSIIHFSLEKEWLRQSEEKKDFFFDITKEDYKAKNNNKKIKEDV